MAWRLAKSLLTLRVQINARYPNRSKVSDGAVGDLAHSKSKSDHNPRDGVVTAIDITNDLKNGPDLAGMIPYLMADPRTKYIIFNKKIYNPSISSGAARPYSGANAHQKHLHLSVDWDKKDQAHNWALAPANKPLTVVEEPALTKPANAIKRFEVLGWSKLAATVLVANLLWESGGNVLKPMAIKYSAHGDKGKDGKYHSHGAGQWNDKHGRYDGLLNFARERGAAWNDPETQLRFLDFELRNTEKKAAKELRAATTLKDAMTAAIKVWRPGTPHAAKRLEIATKLYEAK
jgi:hypothetical protein